LALISVVALVATGTLNALLQLDTVEQMWRTDYGQVLTAKVALVFAALVAASFSRRRVQREDAAWSTVRFEAGAVLAVLALTAVLASTSPPSTITAAPVLPRTGATVTMDLGEGRSAQVHVDGLGTSGSYIHVELLDRRGQSLRVDVAELQAHHAARGLGPLQIELSRRPAGWLGDFTFPLPGRWALTLTVESSRLGGLVTAGTLRIT
jgi:copper transport protein